MPIRDLLSVLFRRQASPPVRGPCYDFCNNATVTAQNIGYNPILCINATFVTAVQQCGNCTSYQEANNLTQPPSQSPPWMNYLVYCEADGQDTFSNSSFGAIPVPSDLVPVLQSQDSLISSLEVAKSTTLMSITRDPASESSTTVSQASQPAVNTPTPSRHQQQHVIAGATVGAAAGIIGVVAIAMLCSRRWRRSKVKVEVPPEKAQLHSESVQPKLFELKGSVVDVFSVSELAGPELHRAEVPGSEVARSELAAEEHEVDESMPGLSTQEKSPGESKVAS